MNKPIFGIYGASGFGREIMPSARTIVQKLDVDNDQLFFIDDRPTSGVINGHTVLSYSQFVRIDAPERFICIAIAAGEVRAKLAEKIAEDRVIPWAVTSAHAVIMDKVTIGEGAILCPFVTLTSNIKIGRFFHANIYSYVAHDCRIGDFVTFAPGVKCNGNIWIEDYAYIGTGAVLKQGSPQKPLIIGAGATVGMGAVVTKDVLPRETVVGNPAKRLEKG
jgi:sugar O-acyltransferase (sialic acid O-acetyltransferase NeuD family)